MKNAIFAATLMLILIIQAGCGNRETTLTIPGDQGAPAADPVDPYGDPVVYGEDPFAGFPRVFELEYPGVAVGTGIEPAAGGAWSVQIAACSGEADAVRLGEIASSRTGLPFFVDREDLWWKVRLGSYQSREDAAEGLETAGGSGYRDAWIVERSLDSNR